MTKPVDGSAALRALREVEDPDGRADLVRELIRRSRDMGVVKKALAVWAEAGHDPELKPLIRDRYDWFDADGKRRDAGCYIRAAMVESVRPLAVPADSEWFEHALFTYEFLPAGEVGTSLRAAALLALADVDPDRAAWHAVRLLAEPPPYTQTMTGQPAVTAARLLAAQGRTLSVYGAACTPSDPAPAVSELVGECLRLLADDLPAPLLGGLVERHMETPSDVVLMGLLDLLLRHEHGEDHAEAIEKFLRTTKRLEIHRYLATAIVASRKRGLADALRAAARSERDPKRVPALREALALMPPDDDTERLIERLSEIA